MTRTAQQLFDAALTDDQVRAKLNGLVLTRPESARFHTSTGWFGVEVRLESVQGLGVFSWPLINFRPWSPSFEVKT